ncbi:MAG: hypothetical protein GXP59_09290 [Deltaproteobacteria bacterium]|nr:hypothetical protein [Deltaproteobacteria bacterium]
MYEHKHDGTPNPEIKQNHHSAMTKETTQPPGEKLRKTIKWISETQLEHPEIKRREVIQQAQIRFNLSPRDCEFLNKNFSGEE